MKKHYARIRQPLSKLPPKHLGTYLEHSCYGPYGVNEWKLPFGKTISTLALYYGKHGEIPFTVRLKPTKNCLDTPEMRRREGS